MKRILPVVLLLLVLNLKPVATLAQQTPPENPILTPINGQLTFSSNAGLVILNTFDGTWQPVPEGGTDGVWDSTRTILASIYYDDNSIRLFDTTSNTTRKLFLGQPGENNAENRQIVGWSADGQSIMTLVHNWDGEPINYGGFSHRLEIINLASEEITVVLDIPSQTLMETMFPVPPDSKNVVLDFLYRARWNPIYPDWTLVQVNGVGKNSTTGEDIGVYETGIYNLITRQYISLKTLFPQMVISFTDWSADGRKWR